MTSRSRRTIRLLVLAAGLALAAATATACDVAAQKVGNGSQGGVEGVGNNTGNKLGGVS